MACDKCLSKKENENANDWIEADWIGTLADYLIEFATPAFEHQDRELLEKVLSDYFKIDYKGV